MERGIRMKKWIILLIAATLTLLLLVAGCGGKVVATVNGENITQQELDKEVDMYKAGLENQGADFSGEEGKEIMDRLRQDVLKQLIDETLLLQQVEKRSLEPSSEEVQKEIKKIRDNFETEGEYKKFLAANGVNEPQLSDYVEKQLAVQKLVDEVTADVKVTDQEVKQYYQENEENFTQPEERKVRHILIGSEGSGMDTERSQVDAKIEAERLLQKIEQGTDFSQLAKEYSEDPGTKDNGGLLTITRGGGFVQEFEDAAFNLAEGEVSPSPVKTQYGYHIIKVEEIIPSEVQSLEAVKDQIKTSLEDTRRAGEFTDYVEDLRKEAKIDNKLSNKDEKSTQK
ncbi:MAG: peptidylprolyl isomerase [Firmicutes bacterium]|nr:peptidylprolyl isomerase [Bacillota bacterium]